MQARMRMTEQEFHERAYAFFSSWIEDFQDRVKEAMTEEEEAQYQAELEEINDLCETAEALCARDEEPDPIDEDEDY